MNGKGPTWSFYPPCLMSIDSITKLYFIQDETFFKHITLKDYYKLIKLLMAK